jgi:hypothetical protein
VNNSTTTFTPRQSDTFGFNGVTNEITFHKGGRELKFTIQDNNPFIKANEINKFFDFINQLVKVEFYNELKKYANKGGAE